MYTKSERLIYSILGTTKSDIRPLTLAIEAIIDIHFIDCVPRWEIKICEAIYQSVADKINKSASSTSRSIQRLSNECWDIAKRRGMINTIVGIDLNESPDPSDIVFYFAFLVHFDKPFFDILK